jgi:hypothetical protein
MSRFAFLQAEWPDVHDTAARAEALAIPDSRTACFHARRGLERWFTSAQVDDLVSVLTRVRARAVA